MAAMSFIRSLAAVGLSLFIIPALATQRSYAAKAEFKRESPCPANGQRRGPCTGYVVDHIVPLCAGGPDHPSNMQWQTVVEGKAKDLEERKKCKRRTVTTYCLSNRHIALHNSTYEDDHKQSVLDGLLERRCFSRDVDCRRYA